MAQNNLPQSLVTTRLNQQPYPVSFPDGVNGAPVTTGRHNRFGWLYIKVDSSDTNSISSYIGLGGMMSFSVRESTGGRFQPQAGTDYLEYVMGARQWSGSGTRFQPRGFDLKQNIDDAYNNKLHDVDFRVTPIWLCYNYNYSTPDGLQQYEVAQWNYAKCFITDYETIFISGPNDLIQENFSFIGAGEFRTDGNKTQFTSNNAIWGGSSFSQTGNYNSIPSNPLGQP